jgi:hypothetical protein
MLSSFQNNSFSAPPAGSSVLQISFALVETETERELTNEIEN